MSSTQIVPAINWNEVMQTSVREVGGFNNYLIFYKALYQTGQLIQFSEAFNKTSAKMAQMYPEECFYLEEIDSPDKVGKLLWDMGVACFYIQTNNPQDMPTQNHYLFVPNVAGVTLFEQVHHICASMAEVRSTSD
jgi:hypothetical protein